jgi:hypothetical protein
MEQQEYVSPRFHVIICLHDDSEKPFFKKNSVINLVVVDYTINRRNRRTSDDLQDASVTGRQEQPLILSHLSLLSFSSLLVRERIFEVANTGFAQFMKLC